MSRKRLFNDKEKWCNKCKDWLPLEAFGENNSTVSGKQDYCKTCHGAYYPDVFWKKVEVVDKKLAEKYGMVPGEYLNLWREQDKSCKICATPLVLYQRDTHVHVVGNKKVLLCTECNKGLSAFKDDAQLLKNALKIIRSDQTDKP